MFSEARQSDPAPAQTPDAGIVFDIQRFSVHDGPGIRTLVFLKGCPLSCEWCANPEGRQPGPEILFDPARCVGCRVCEGVCTNGAALVAEGGTPVFERGRCLACGACVEVCPSGARALAGRSMSVQTVLAEVLKDEPFYRNSGGGLTLGGGEPLAQPDFAAGILRASRDRAIHTAVETSGHVPWPRLRQALPWTDLFLYDLKHPDPDAHRAHTGGDVGLVMGNLDRLLEAGARVWPRVAVIPGFNDDPAVFGELVRQVAGLGLGEIHLLPYHRLGQAKYRLLGREEVFRGREAIREGRLEELAALARAAGLAVTVGG